MELADPCTDPPLQSLLDMPAAWMQQLAEALNPSEQLSLFQTCSTMRDLMLAARGVTLRIQRDLLQDRPDAAAASLTLACTHSPSVKLVLIGNCSEAPVDINASACSLMLGAAAGAGLQGVCSAQLEGLVLDALVPSWLTSTCLHMTILHLRHCHFSSLPAPTTSIPTCSQLKQLHLHCPPDLTQQPTLAQWQHQLGALTGLDSLEVHCNQYESLEPDWLQCCSETIGPQLTALSISCLPFGEGLPSEFGVWFPNLIKMDLTGDFTVGDDDLKVLLSISTLRSLQCGAFALQEDHSHRPCPWTHLGVAELKFDQLARLPLEGLQSVQANPGPQSINLGLKRLDIYLDMPLHVGRIQAMRRVVEAINRCGGLQLGGVEEVCLDGCRSPPDAIPSLASILALLSTSQIRHFRLDAVYSVTAEVLAAMAQHLAIPTLETIAFSNICWDPCTFVEEAWPLVLSSLPPQVEKVRLQLPKEHLSERHLTEMCVHASRPVTLSIRPEAIQGVGWAGWQERVRAAMAAAGHQHVKLKSCFIEDAGMGESEIESEDESEGGSEDERE